MKPSICLIISVFTYLISFSQTRFASNNTQSFPEVIQAVLHDFPHNFSDIRGELILAQGEIENYASRVELPGSELCLITRYHSLEDTTASWQAKMFRNEDFT